MFVDVLPKWERWTYWILGLYSIGHMIVALYLEGEKYKDELSPVLSPGWSWLGRLRDLTDTDWQIWQHSIQRVLSLNVIHVLLSQLCFHLKVGKEVHTRVLLVYDVVAACAFLGVRVVVLLFFMASVMFATSLLGSVLLVWLVEAAMISSLNCSTTYQIQITYLRLNKTTDIFSFFIATVYLNIHLLSFALEKIMYQKSKLEPRKAKTQRETGDCDQIEPARSSDGKVVTGEKCGSDTCPACRGKLDPSHACSITGPDTLDCDPSFVDLLFYSFYLPRLSVGPIIIYRDFHSQVTASFSYSSFRPDVWDIVKTLFRLALWAFFVDFQLHFLYYNAFCSLNTELITKTSYWALSAIGYIQGQMFMVKYVVIYGLPMQLSRFDGIRPLAVPRCISWVYSYSDMWKHFDVGLYTFIKTHIYIPCGGSRAGFIRQTIASFLSFTFVYIFHGTQLSIFIWCIGNFLMGLLEAIGQLLEQSPAGTRLKSQLGPAMCLRIKAILICPVYLSSCMQVFYFFFGNEKGSVFVSRFITEASWTTLVPKCVFLICCIHNALYIHQVYKHKKKSNYDEHKFKEHKTRN